MAAARDTADIAEARLTRTGSPYELETHATEFGPERRFKYGGKRLLELIGKSSDRANAPFLITPALTLTHADIFNEASMLARYLRDFHKIEVCERVGLICPSGPGWIVCFLGILGAGGVPVLVNVDQPETLQHCLEMANPALLIVDREFDQRIEGSHGYAVESLAYGKTFYRTSYRLNKLSRESPTNGGGHGLISFTSGSTGKPKAVFSPDQALVTGLLNMLLAGAIARIQSPSLPGNNGAPACSLVGAPLYHVSGYTQLLLTMLVGGRLAINPDIPALTRFIREKGITSLSGLNSEAIFELLAGSEIDYGQTKLRSWNISGVALRKNVADAIAEKLPNVTLTTGYGLTETCGGISAIAGKALHYDLSSSGKVVPTAEIQIKNDLEKEMGAGALGEIWLRGPMIMAGYLSSSGDLAGLKNGWFKTGDIGYLSPGRQLHVLDRSTDVFQIASKQISSGEIERRIIEISDIQDVCLVRFTRFDNLMLGLAIVGTSTNKQKISSMRAQLAKDFNVPISRIVMLALERLPRTASGKVARAELKKVFLASLDNE